MKYRVIPDNERGSFLPKHFDDYMRFETVVYNTMSAFTGGEYNGGLWEFREYENGAPMMVFPKDGLVDVVSSSNYYTGKMSWEALSIAVNALVANWIGEYDTYYDMMDVLGAHEEAGEMYALVD